MAEVRSGDAVLARHVVEIRERGVDALEFRVVVGKRVEIATQFHRGLGEMGMRASGQVDRSP